MKLREKLGEKNVGVTNDLTQNQRNQLSDLRKENKRGYFLRNRLIVENIQPSDNTHRIRSGSNAIEDDVIRSGTNENVHANDLNPSSQPVRGSGHRRGGGSGRGSRNYVNNAGSSLRDHDRDRAHDRTSRRVGGSDDRQNTSSQNSLVRRGAGRGRAGRAAGELRSRDSRRRAGSLDDWIHRAGTSGHHSTQSGVCGDLSGVGSGLHDGFSGVGGGSRGNAGGGDVHGGVGSGLHGVGGGLRCGSGDVRSSVDGGSRDGVGNGLRGGVSGGLRDGVGGGLRGGSGGVGSGLPDGMGGGLRSGVGGGLRGGSDGVGGGLPDGVGGGWHSDPGVGDVPTRSPSHEMYNGNDTIIDITSSMSV